MSVHECPFEYQLSFQLLPGDGLGLETGIDLPVVGAHLTCKGSRVSIKKGAFETLEAAKQEGLRLRRAILLWALGSKHPVDMNFNQDEIRGLRVGKQSAAISLSINATGNVVINAENAVCLIAKWYEDDIKLSDNEELAVELFCSALFDGQPKSQFLTLMTALEALIYRHPRSKAAQQLVDKLKDEVANADLEEDERKSLVGSFKELKKESIKQAGRRYAKALLGRYQVEQDQDVAPILFFGKCYDLRSSIVHGASMTEEEKKMLRHLHNSRELYRFVGDALEHLIKQRSKNL